MSDINWGKYPKARTCSIIFYGEGFETLGMDELIERPKPELKTVDDAVEWANGEWPSDDFIGIAYCNDENKFIPYMKGSRIDLGERKSRKSVCTREEFEACVAAKTAKSEPEWTHTDGINKCKIIYTKGELSWIKCELGGDYVVHNDCLKPIKPTITKAEAWDKLGEDFAPSAMYMSIICAYEIKD